MDRMLTRMLGRFVGQALGKGVDKGAEYIARRNSPDGEARDPTPEQRAQVRRNGRNAKQAMRMMRRLGRF
jgi:hypothetical protein